MRAVPGLVVHQLFAAWRGWVAFALLAGLAAGVVLAAVSRGGPTALTRGSWRPRRPRTHLSRRPARGRWATTTRFPGCRRCPRLRRSPASRRCPQVPMAGQSPAPRNSSYASGAASIRRVSSELRDVSRHRLMTPPSEGLLREGLSVAGDESEQRSRHGNRLQRALTPVGLEYSI